MPTTERRVPCYDRLRVFAAFCMIVLHVCAGPWQTLPPDTDAWQMINFCDALVRFCVPVFFMVSGVFLLSPAREVPMRRLFGRYILRMVLSYLVWSAAYSAVFNLLLPETPDASAFWRDFILGHYHMWFILTMIGLYLAVPILRCVCREKKTEQYFLVVSLITVFGGNVLKLIPPIADYVSATMTKLHVETFLGVTCLFVLGHYLAAYGLPRWAEHLICLLAGLSLIFTTLETARLSMLDGAGNSRYFAYLLPNTLCVATAVFLLFRRFGNTPLRSAGGAKLLMGAAKMTFGIYLVHDFFIRLLAGIGLTADAIFPLAAVPLTALCVWVLSAATVWLLGRIPWVRDYLI